MRVLHVIPSLAIGGSERQLLELIVHASDPTCHHVTVFDEHEPAGHDLPNPPTWVGPLGRDAVAAARMPLILTRLRRVIRERGIDLVHAHHDVGEVVAAVATPRRVPIVAERQGLGSAWLQRRALRPILGLAHRRADLLICNSRYLETQARRHDPAVPAIEVVYPGVDTDRFAPAPPPSWDAPTVVVVANLHRVKRHDRFLRAFARVLERVPRASAILAGAGPEEPGLRRIAAELGLQGSVEFAGLLVDPRTAIGRAHVACLTSDSEGFPNALLEAMAMGRPVVATRVGGIPELARDGIDGILTDTSVDDVARGLERLLGAPATAEEMGTRAAERASTFGLARMVDGVESAYRKVGR